MRREWCSIRSLHVHVATQPKKSDGRQYMDMLYQCGVFVHGIPLLITNHFSFFSYGGRVAAGVPPRKGPAPPEQCHLVGAGLDDGRTGAEYEGSHRGGAANHPGRGKVLHRPRP